MRSVCVCVCACWGGGGATTACQNRSLQADLFSLDHHNCTAYPKTGCQGDQGILMKCQKNWMGMRRGEWGAGRGNNAPNRPLFLILFFFFFFFPFFFPALITTAIPLIQTRVVKVTRRCCSLPADHTGLLTDQRPPTHQQMSFNFRSKARDTPVQQNRWFLWKRTRTVKSMVELTATSNKTCRKDN